MQFILQHGIGWFLCIFIVNAYRVTCKFAFLTEKLHLIFIGTQIC